MGYFANNTEGLDYYSFYCEKCVHEREGCAVWFAHELWSYRDCNDKDSILHMLIPRDEKGYNMKCMMFFPAQDKHPSLTGTSES